MSLPTSLLRQSPLNAFTTCTSVNTFAAVSHKDLDRLRSESERVDLRELIGRGWVCFLLGGGKVREDERRLAIGLVVFASL
eukprot:m.22776 g.22776  ORF g.22776 m.22776 type:complete len:81 (+) comp8896_c0_seq1:350-592(+)